MLIKVANITIEGRWGGPQKRILEITRLLKQDSEIEPIVIFPKGEDSSFFRKKLEQEQIKYIETSLSSPQRDMRKIIWFLLFFIWEALKLAKLLNREQVDIVHCNGCWQMQGVIAGILAQKKVIWHLNDTRGSVFRFSVLLLGRAVDVFCISANKVGKIYLDRSFLKNKPAYLIRPPVNTTLFSAKDSEAYFDEQEKITIGTLCNLNPIKDIGLFLDVIETISHKSGFFLRFILAGTVFKSHIKYAETICERIQTMKQRGIDIEYMDSVQDAVEFYDQIDIFLCTSLRESGPMTVFEAMSMQKAVVTSNVGDMNEIFADGIDGFVIDNRCPEDFANRILTLAQNRQLLSDFGNKAREKAVKNLDVSVCALKHKQMYKAVLR